MLRARPLVGGIFVSLSWLIPHPQVEWSFNSALFIKGNYQIKVGNLQVAFAGLPFATQAVENLAAMIPETTKFLDDAFSPKVAVPQMEIIKLSI